MYPHTSSYKSNTDVGSTRYSTRLIFSLIIVVEMNAKRSSRFESLITHVCDSTNTSRALEQSVRGILNEPVWGQTCRNAYRLHVSANADRIAMDEGLTASVWLACSSGELIQNGTYN